MALRLQCLTPCTVEESAHSILLLSLLYFPLEKRRGTLSSLLVDRRCARIAFTIASVGHEPPQY